MANWETLLGKTREEVVEILGQPNQIGGTSRQYRTPAIYKYGDIEVWFMPWKNGKCHQVFDESKHETICKRT